MQKQQKKRRKKERQEEEEEMKMQLKLTQAAQDQATPDSGHRATQVPPCKLGCTQTRSQRDPGRARPRSQRDLGPT